MTVGKEETTCGFSTGALNSSHACRVQMQCSIPCVRARSHVRGAIPKTTVDESLCHGDTGSVAVGSGGDYLDYDADPGACVVTPCQ